MTDIARIDAAVSAESGEFQNIAIVMGPGIFLSLLALNLNRGFFDRCLGLWHGEIRQGSPL